MEAALTCVGFGLWAGAIMTEYEQRSPLHDTHHCFLLPGGTAWRVPIMPAHLSVPMPSSQAKRTEEQPGTDFRGKYTGAEQVSPRHPLLSLLSLLSLPPPTPLTPPTPPPPPRSRPRWKT